MNQEHYDILMKGVDVWNEWRWDNPGVRPDLEEADLRQAELNATVISGVDLNEANLSGADLSGANLNAAFLSEANLYNVNLNGADLGKADLSEANIILADLRGAILRGADFSKANLSSVNLNRSDLSGAILRETILRSSDLTGANLSETGLIGTILFLAKLAEANLSGADLSGADLSGANLSAANLSGAVLEDANLNDANLNGVDFEKAYFGSTSLNNVDLAKCQNLLLSRHLSPSMVDSQTLALSKGKIPDGFLRGIGMKNWEIQAAKLHDPTLSPSQITDLVYQIDHLRNTNPMQVHNLFISYSHADAPFVDALEILLKERDISFWRDVHNASAGPLESIVLRAMNQNPVVLIILSKNSIQSDWVEFELDKARKLEKDIGKHVICPIALDDTWKWTGVGFSELLKMQLKKYNVLDFSDWQDETKFKDKFSRLVEGLDLFYR